MPIKAARMRGSLMILTRTEVIETLYKSPSTHQIISAAIVRQVFALMAGFTLYMPIKDIEMVMYRPGRGLFVSKFNLGFRRGHESTVLASPFGGGGPRAAETCYRAFVP
jgi:hypothetical protein